MSAGVSAGESPVGDRHQPPLFDRWLLRGCGDRHRQSVCGDWRLRCSPGPSPGQHRCCSGRIQLTGVMAWRAFASASCSSAAPGSTGGVVATTGAAGPARCIMKPMPLTASTSTMAVPYKPQPCSGPLVSSWRLPCNGGDDGDVCLGRWSVSRPQQAARVVRAGGGNRSDGKGSAEASWPPREDRRRRCSGAAPGTSLASSPGRTSAGPNPCSTHGRARDRARGDTARAPPRCPRSGVPSRCALPRSTCRSGYQGPRSRSGRAPTGAPHGTGNTLGRILEHQVVDGRAADPQRVVRHGALPLKSAIPVYAQRGHDTTPGSWSISAGYATTTVTSAGVSAPLDAAALRADGGGTRALYSNSMRSFERPLRALRRLVLASALEGSAVLLLATTAVLPAEAQSRAPDAQVTPASTVSTPSAHTGPGTTTPSNNWLRRSRRPTPTRRCCARARRSHAGAMTTRSPG